MRSPSIDLDLVVRRATVVAENVVELELVDPTGASLPEWAPGSHIDVVAGDLVRQYSLSGVITDTHVWRVAVLLETASRGGSQWMHSLAPGSHIRVSGLRNHFPLDEATEYLFIAGGIGITPLIPMIEHVATTGASWQLVHIGRNTARLPYSSRLAERYPGHVTMAAVDETGRPDVGALIAGTRSGSTVYCCGPEGLMQHAEEAGRAAGVEVRVERFVPRERETDENGEHSFVVKLTESELTLTVPEDRSILDVVTEAGVFVLSSCTEGTCGSCETEVVEGAVDHRDSILTDSERDANTVMFVCCSRARGDSLVLRL